MDWLKKFLNFDVDVNINTQEVNQTIYVLGTVAIVVIIVYHYSN